MDLARPQTAVAAALERSVLQRSSLTMKAYFSGLAVGLSLFVVACSSSAPSTPSPSPSGSSNPDDGNKEGAPAAAAQAQTTAPPPATPAAGAPTLTAVNPSSVAAGSPTPVSVTLTGTNFAQGATVTLAGAPIAATVVNATTITVMVTPDKLAAPGNLVFAIQNAAAKSNELSLVVTGAGVGGPSALVSLSPSSAPVATTSVGSLLVTVNGSGFDQTSVLVFNGTDVATSVLGPTTLQGNVPNGLLAFAGQVNVTVRHGSTVSSALTFTVGGADMGGGLCQMSCSQLGLFAGQCVDLGGGGGGGFGGGLDLGFGFDFGGGIGIGINFGNGGGGSNVVQCGFDGCVLPGCQ
jgi:hypothetical protein